MQVLRQVLAQDTRNRYRLYFREAPGAGLLPARAGTECRVIPLPRLWTHVGLSGEMLRHSPDVLFVPSHVLPLVSPRRTVVVVYDVGHRIFPSAYRPLDRLYQEWSIRRHVRMASEILTISEAAKHDLVQMFGVDGKRVSVAPPAVDAQFAPPSAARMAAVREQYGLPKEYLLHVGTLKPRKNLPRLVEAFARADLRPEVILVLAGQVEWGKGDIEQAIAAAGVRDRVRLLNYPSDDELPALYGGALGVAVVSLHEGFGMPALEAMACGAPVIASNRGSLPEVVGNCGVLVDPLRVPSIADGISRLANDEPLRQDLGRRGAERARTFTWEAAGRVALEAINRAGGLEPSR